jgi:dUTP pyrophosphatase
MPRAKKVTIESKERVFEKEKLALEYRRFDKTLPALSRENERNAGFDLFARLDKPVVLAPGEVAVIPLNVATLIPSFGVGLLFQRSSTFRKWGIKLTNSVGVIDSLFCGDGDEWAGEFKNEKNEHAVISNGDKICQAVFLPILPVVLREVEEMGNDTRGGFGISYDNAKEA